MWINRSIAPVLRKAFEQFPIVVLTGARQSGKTSLVRHLLPDADYVSFDIPREAETARLDCETFLAGRREPLVIDEVQYVPSIFRHLKAVVDRDRRPGRYVLTGSQDFSVMKGVVESLAGRAAILSLPPLTVGEISRDAAIQEVDAFCWRGGFPELWQRPELDRDLWMGSYLATYLERDVRNLLNVGSLRDYDRFLRAAAARAGQILVLSDLAHDVGIAPNTAKSWLSILEASRQIHLLEPYHRNAGKRLIKAPKLYFADPGFLAYLLGFPDWTSVVRSPSWGAVWENLVVSETIKQFLNAGRRPPCWFWRTLQGEEVDLVIDCGAERFLAVECKTAADIDPRGLKGLAALEKAYGKEAVERAAVVCRTAKPYPLTAGHRIAAIPLGGDGGLSAWVRERFGF